MSRRDNDVEDRALALLAAHPPAVPAADLATRLSASVRAASSAPSQPSFWERWTRLAWPAAVGASVAAAVLVLLLVRSGAPVPSPTSDPLADAVDVSTDDGVTAILAMGSD